MNKKNKSDFILVIVFAIIIFVPLIWFPIKYVLLATGRSTLTMTDNWEYYQKTGNRYIDLVEGAKVGVTNRVNNYFPFYTDLTSMYHGMNFELNNLLYDGDIVVGKNTDSEVIMFNTENKFYYLKSRYSKEELNKRLDEQVSFYNRLSKIDDVTLNIYMPLRYELMNLSDNNLNDYVIKFGNNLSDNINFGYLEIDTLYDYLEYYYKTDHHWNSLGALEGYLSIAEMMDLDIAIDFDSEIHSVSDIPYYGSMAKSLLSTRVADEFTDNNIKNSCNVSVTGKDNNTYKPKEFKASANKFYDYYVNYFNGQYGEVILDCNNDDDKENLLIISDSVAWQIDYLVASGFNKTYVVNMRYDEFANNTLDLNEYIKKNNITQILFLQEAANIMFDEFNHDLKTRIEVR